MLAARPAALAWSHIDSCLTRGQHGRGRLPAGSWPRHQSSRPGSLLIGPGRGQNKVLRGSPGPPKAGDPGNPGNPAAAPEC